MITEYSVDDDGALHYRDWICVLNDLILEQDILSEAHNSTYSIYYGSTKMYCDLKQMYRWPGMEHEICEFVAKCLIFQQVKQNIRYHRVYYNLS